MRAALYMRLSKDDGRPSKESDSVSIQNQRKILLGYCRENKISQLCEYIDDGYSGTNFNRPSFIKMIHDIELGKIDCVLVKDLSRLGRDYLVTGKYIEEYFPAKNIRFVAVSDGYDSFGGYDDMIPFRNLINEMYARDISKKIRASLSRKMADGEYIGARPPFGFKRSDADRHLLEPVAHKARIVQLIFENALNGLSASAICSVLNSKNIASPSGKSWCPSTVLKILHNKAYCGTLEQGKSIRHGIKSKKRHTVPAPLRYVSTDSHVGIVSCQDFERVQLILSAKTQKNTKIAEKAKLILT